LDESGEFGQFFHHELDKEDDFDFENITQTSPSVLTIDFNEFWRNI